MLPPRRVPHLPVTRVALVLLHLPQPPMPRPVRPVAVLLPVVKPRLEPVVARVVAPFVRSDEAVPVRLVVPFLLRLAALRPLQEVT